MTIMDERPKIEYFNDDPFSGPFSQRLINDVSLLVPYRWCGGLFSHEARLSRRARPCRFRAPTQLPTVSPSASASSHTLFVTVQWPFVPRYSLLFES